MPENDLINILLVDDDELLAEDTQAPVGTSALRDRALPGRKRLGGP
jgi:hypothetical protein